MILYPYQGQSKGDCSRRKYEFRRRQRNKKIYKKKFIVREKIYDDDPDDPDDEDIENFGV